MHRKTRRALQRAVPRKPHKPRSMQMGARWMYKGIDNLRGGIQYSSKNAFVYVDGRNYAKYLDVLECAAYGKNPHK